MIKLSQSSLNELSMGAAQDFDGIEMPSLGANFGAAVGNNFDQAAQEIQFGMSQQSM